MAKRANDVNPQPAASSAPASTGSAVPATDAKQQSAPPSNAPAQDSSAPATPATKPLIDVVRESLAAKEKAQSAPPEPEAEAEPQDDAEPAEATDEPIEPAAEPATPEAEADPEAEDEGEAEEKGPIPYSRFAEVNAKKAAAEKQLEDIRPVLDAYGQIHQFLNEKGLTSDDFSRALHIMDAMKNDPERALQLLQPEIEQLQSVTGSNLPPDLAKAVSDGDITAELAKELASARGKTKLTAAQLERQQQRSQQQLATQQAAQVTQSLQHWMSTVQKTDPDFKPKTAEAPNGPYEMFLALFEQAARNASPRTADDFTRVAQQAYAEVRRSLKAFQPRITTPSRVRSNQSAAVVTTTPPKSLHEAVAARLKSRGISFPLANGKT